MEGPLARNTHRHAVTRSLRLDRTQTRALLTEAPAAYRTRIDTLLLTAFARAVQRRWPAEALTVHVEGHGREALFPDLDVGRTVGWFTSVYPVRLAPPPFPSTIWASSTVPPPKRPGGRPRRSAEPAAIRTRRWAP